MSIKIVKSHYMKGQFFHNDQDQGSFVSFSNSYYFNHIPEGCEEALKRLVEDFEQGIISLAEINYFNVDTLSEAEYNAEKNKYELKISY